MRGKGISRKKLLDEILEGIDVQKKKISVISEYIEKELKKVPRSVEPHLKSYLYTRLKHEYLALADYEIAKNLMEKGVKTQYVQEYLKVSNRFREYLPHS